MDPAFVAAVRTAGETLAREGEQRRFLMRLSEEQAEWRELRQRLGGIGHV
jgi:hypothetical protein